MNDKSQAIWDWLYEGCSAIKDLYFTFSQSNTGDTVLIPDTAYTDEWDDDMPFIDGTGFKHCIFTIVRFVAYSTVPNSTENIRASLDIQQIAEWIEQQEKQKNYPDFPEHCKIQEIQVLPFANGGLVGQDENGAKYMFSMQINYYYDKEI